MQLSAVGLVVGCALGMFAAAFILKIFLPTSADTTLEKWAKRIACVVVVIAFAFGGGFLLRTQLKPGDYAQEQCDRTGCHNPPTWQLRYELMTLYYCDNHKNDAYALSDPERYETEMVKDSSGHNKLDAWEMAQQIARDQLDLPADAEFCDVSEVRSQLNGSRWTIRGDVATYDSAGKRSYIYFNMVFSFISSGYNLLEFSVE